MYNTYHIDLLELGSLNVQKVKDIQNPKMFVATLSIFAREHSVKIDNDWPIAFFITSSTLKET